MTVATDTEMAMLKLPTEIARHCIYSQEQPLLKQPLSRKEHGTNNICIIESLIHFVY